MKLLRSALSLISKNVTTELNLLQRNRFLCTGKTGYNETKPSDLIQDANSESKSIAERNDDEQINSNKKRVIDKTTAIQSDIERGIMITSYSTAGFRLNSRVQVIGPIILFPRAVFAWHVESTDKVDADSLMIFGMIQPKVDTLIIGIGTNETTKNIGKTILKFAHEFKINVEILSTELACTQYNLLASEGRMVGAALIPPQAMSCGEDDIFNSLNLDGKLFTVDMLHSPDIKDARDGNIKIF